MESTGKKLSSEGCRKFDSCLGDCRAKASNEPIQVGPIVPLQVGAAMKDKSSTKPARTALIKKLPGDEYARVKSEYNKLLGYHQWPHI
jgi:hypothetical protein